MKVLGKHYIVNLYQCNSEILSHSDLIEEIIEESAEIGNITVIHSFYKQFNPYGVSGATIIAESHITIHTWPEYRYAALDIFVCNEDSKPMDSIEFIKNRLQAQYMNIELFNRGIIDEKMVD